MAKNVGAKIKEVLSKIGDYFRNISFDRIKDKLKDVKGFLSKALDWFKGIKDKITQPFENLMSKFSPLGQGIIKGLLSGLMSINPVTMIIQLIGKILNAFKKGLAINSPSKKMMEIGKFIIWGLINGLKGAVQGVLTFVGEFVTNVIGWITTSVPMVISAVVTLFDTVWTEIINIHSKFLYTRDLAGVFM